MWNNSTHNKLNIQNIYKYLTSNLIWKHSNIMLSGSRKGKAVTRTWANGTRGGGKCWEWSRYEHKCFEFGIELQVSFIMNSNFCPNYMLHTFHFLLYHFLMQYACFCLKVVLHGVLFSCVVDNMMSLSHTIWGLFMMKSQETHHNKANHDLFQLVVSSVKFN